MTWFGSSFPCIERHHIWVWARHMIACAFEIHLRTPGNTDATRTTWTSHHLWQKKIPMTAKLEWKGAPKWCACENLLRKVKCFSWTKHRKTGIFEEQIASVRGLAKVKRRKYHLHWETEQLDALQCWLNAGKVHQTELRFSLISFLIGEKIWKKRFYDLLKKTIMHVCSDWLKRIQCTLAVTG